MGRSPYDRHSLEEPTSGVISSVVPESGPSQSLRADAIAPGEVIADKYVVERVIGVGGVAIVVAARHVELEETVAIKILQPELQTRKEIMQRFAREAKAAVRIKSEYAARVFDVGVARGRGPYLVMEYLEGLDLGHYLGSHGPLPIKRAVEYVMQACEALAVAHVNGIVHRDIKPENLFLARRGDGTEIIKVLDFGISKAALTSSVFGLPDDALKTQELMGTPLYMSPEQIRETSTVDRRADIWSLGVVLYELITGELAFSGEAITKICADVLEKDPPPLSRYVVDLPDGLQSVVSRCLAKDPERRFQNVAELAIALLPFGPSRARILAERSSTILRAAGHVDGGVMVKFHSSAPPPPLLPGASPSDNPDAAALRSPRVPSMSTLPGMQHLTNPEALNSIAIEGRRTRRIVTFASIIVLAFAGIATFAVVSNRRAAVVTPAPVADRPIAVVTDPPGARVEWEGKLLGETPLSTTLPVGIHSLKLTHEGYAPETLSVTVSPNDAEGRKAQLTMSKVDAAASAKASAAPAKEASKPPAVRPGAPANVNASLPRIATSSVGAAPPPPGAVADVTGQSSAKASAAPAPKHVKVIGEKKTNVVVVE
ncbi:serine/threonine protein kinase [Labilithrix luteola]|uniref:Serine/threonine protein kinase n=1 Tax=Labilithrix luteola TaxID=1391654 RepID=A0A0K1PR93_9BACT|nr:serine/threonine-protein kinase [Labilithrix luteola]AKU95896.1 serine/threonine protein kinase [Labilithrix luteola]